MANYLLTFLLFFLPFIIVPIGSSQFEIPKVIASEICIDILFVLVIYKQRLSFFKSLNNKQVVLFEILVLLTIYQLHFLQTPFMFFGDPTRLQGILLLWHLMLFSLIASRFEFKKLSYYWYAGLLLLIVILSLFIGNQNGRAVATLGEPNALAAFTIFLWPFLFFSNLKKTKFKIIMRIFSIICTLIIIFLSGSRSGFLAFGMQIIFYLLWFVGNCSPKKVIAITTFFVAVTYSFPFFDMGLYENRAEVWRTAVQTGIQQPLLGSGFGNMEISLNKTIHGIHNTLVGYSVDSAHNILLDWWVQGGVLGLGILAVFLVFAIKNYSSQKRGFELLLLFGIFTTLSFNPASVVSLIAFWWLIGRSFAKKSSVKLELNAR
ncbi:MAG TPA: O-antigen ligase family protein [Candidatus Acidoferrales bacterium]|nr:O-antigen ligase family protein [Candidatus Acidoferrales bacterium]